MHLKVYVSGVITASVQHLWDVVRDYGQAHTWFGMYRGVKTFTSLLPGQINCQIGAMRFVIIGHSGFVDQLDALDDERYIMKYKLISHPQNTNPFPGAFLNFRANIQLKEVTRGAATFMQWTGEFDTDPQDCEIMRQSIEELFEAGFLELENLVAPPMARSMYHGGQAPPPVGVMGEGQLGNLQRGLGSMNLKPSESLPTGFGPMSASSFPPARSPRSGPESMASEPAPTAHGRGGQDSGSLASSPQTYDGPSAPRPGSGGPMLNHWTSGGSNSTINLSTLPNRRSGEEVEGYKRQPRSRSTQEGIPEGRPYTEGPTLPFAFQGQVNQRQAAMPPPDGFTRYQHQQQARQGNVGMEVPERDSLGSAASDQAADMQYQTSHHPDRLLQEREDYKASILAGQRFQRLSHHPSDASLQSAQLAQETLSEPDWSRVMQPKDEEEPALRSVSNSQVSSPHMVQPSQESKNHQEWIRLMQQREAEVQHRENKRRGSPGPVPGSAFGTGQKSAHPNPGGPFGAASNKGGPFAAAARLPPRDSGSVRRSNSQQSLASLLSAGGSGHLDRSAGSAVDERLAFPQQQGGGGADYHSTDRVGNDLRNLWPSN